MILRLLLVNDGTFYRIIYRIIPCFLSHIASHISQFSVAFFPRPWSNDIDIIVLILVWKIRYLSFSRKLTFTLVLTWLTWLRFIQNIFKNYNVVIVYPPVSVTHLVTKWF